MEVGFLPCADEIEPSPAVHSLIDRRVGMQVSDRGFLETVSEEFRDKFNGVLNSQHLIDVG